MPNAVLLHVRVEGEVTIVVELEGQTVRITPGQALTIAEKLATAVDVIDGHCQAEALS